MTKYQPQRREEIIKNLEMIAESKQLGLSDHVRASLWNAIEMLEDYKEIQVKLAKAVQPGEFL